MKYYFKLQSRRLKRWLKNAGINPFLGLILGAALFTILSKFLFYKTEYAKWIYLFITISFILQCSEPKRNNTLRSIFQTKDYFALRIVENLLLTLPFLGYLLYEKEFVTGLTLLPISIGMAFFRKKWLINSTIPTPFKKHPFEFIVGFRKTFLFIFGAYFIIFKAIEVNNYNLGLFGLVLIFIISMFYFQKPEPKYYVWIYSYQTKEFLKQKIITSIICISILSFLGLGAILIAFSSKWLSTLFVYLGGHIVLSSMILAKYSAFPNEINIPQGILYGLSLLFPPMLLITMWIFYSQSKKRIKPILG